MGVSKVRFTGGEPLVRRDIVEMVQQIGALPGIEDLSMSTNASQLAKHAKVIREAGVSRLNVSLDTLRPDVFRQITQGDLNSVIEGLMAARDAGIDKFQRVDTIQLFDDYDQLYQKVKIMGEESIARIIEFKEAKKIEIPMTYQLALIK